MELKYTERNVDRENSPALAYKEVSFDLRLKQTLNQACALAALPVLCAVIKSIKLQMQTNQG